MPVLEVNVSGKIANNPDKSQNIVCGNGDYIVKFNFSQEWSGHNVKTALFVFNRKTVPVVFEGDSCDAPIVDNAELCAIGVKAGEIYTTTPAYFNCLKSISDIGGEIAPPTKDVYDEIMELLNKALSGGTTIPIGGKKNQVLAKKSDADFDTYWVDDQAGVGGVTEETVREIVADIVPDWAKEPTKPTYTASEVGALPSDTPLFSGDYNDLSNKPEIPSVEGLATEEYVDEKIGDINTALESILGV